MSTNDRIRAIRELTLTFEEKKHIRYLLCHKLKITSSHVIVNMDIVQFYALLGAINYSFRVHILTGRFAITFHK